MSQTGRPSAATADSLAVTMEGVDKYYGDFHALKSIDLTVRRGEKIVVCGPSGSGKSTLIRCINQLESVQKAERSSSTASS
jgi:polar amino acid transport system ATP-binding protein